MNTFVKYSDKTRDQLAAELALAHQRIADLEASQPVPLAAALNADVNAIVITNRAGLIQWVNPAFCRLTGYQADEAIGRNPSELVKSGHHDHRFYREMWETIVAGRVWRGEMINRRKDGSLYTEEQTITPVRNGLGDISHFIAVKQDVTERTRAEAEIRVRAQISAVRAAIGLSLTKAQSLAEALQQCAEALVGYLGASLAGIWTLDEGDGRPQLQATAGHLAGNGILRSMPFTQRELAPAPHDRPRGGIATVIGNAPAMDDAWARHAGMETCVRVPLIIDEHANGVMALFARAPLPDAVIAALPSVADHLALGIERHRSAKALLTAEERMRFALSNANVGVWDMDYVTGVLRLSETQEAHYGFLPGTFDGTFESFVDRIHADDRASVLEAISAAMEVGSDFSVDNRAVWPDGRLRWLSSAGRILLDREGAPVRGVGISLDVTERRTLEAQYRQAQKMEAVGRLAGGVAHDFNNLLTAILGYCELLLPDFHPDHPHRANLEEIQKAGTQAAGLTRQLLAFSRKQIVEPKLFDVNQAVREMLGMLVRLIGEDVTVSLNLSPTPVPILADRGQVEQIVMNLALNGRDAMPNGGTLTIATAVTELDLGYTRTHLDTKPGRYVSLVVTDTGIGMTPHVRSRLFEPFFTTKEVGKGTGLGLATVHGIVTQAGGSIEVNSELGRGTSLHVYFPSPEAPQTVEDAPQPVVRTRPAGKTVLVVEDAEGLLELAQRLLERQGYAVIAAGNAEDALRLLDDNPSIDVILTDVIMPGVSGPELARLAIQRRPALKVIFMSGYTEDVIVHHGVLRPEIAFLNKPFTSEMLGRKIQEVLDL